MNENEKELHRLAALGAGYEVYFWSDKVARMDLPLRPLWEPCKNAGDSFKLMIDCGLSVKTCTKKKRAQAISDIAGKAICGFPHGTGSKGAELAMMEAIFLVAAEHGRIKEAGI